MATSSESSEKEPLLSNRNDKIVLRPRANRKAPIATVLCILMTEFCERLTYYGISASLVLFCQDILKLETPVPSVLAMVFQGTSYILPVIGGLLADRYVGRYNAIFGAALIYFVGTSLLCAVSYDYKPANRMSQAAKVSFVVVSLLFISAGTGGIKSNVSPLGANQVQHLGPKAVERFFNWFYWFINAGSFFAFTFVVYVQQEKSFFYGYLISEVALLIAIIVFVLGSRLGYADTSPDADSRALDTIKITWYGIKGLFKKKSAAEQNVNWLNRAGLGRVGRWTREAIEDTRSVLRLALVFLIFIIYWAAYSQGLTSFVIQAKNMDLMIGSFTIPAASLSVFQIIGLLLLLPLLDHGVYPLLRYLGFRVTPLQRIGCGLLIGTSYMIVAGFVEIERKKFIDEYGLVQQELFHEKINASSMTVFYQVPQYVLQATSEALVSVTGLEMAFTQSPDYLRGLMMGVCLATSGIGYYLASALVAVVSAANASWYPTDHMNTGHLEYFFFLLAGLMLLNFFIFLPVSIYCYEYREDINSKELTPQNTADSLPKTEP